MSTNGTPTISIIIPAFNEQERLAGVLKTVVDSGLGEVICVDDCSSDNTCEIAKSINGVKVLSYNKNQGKAYAVWTGVREAKGDIVMFVDADLIGLTPALLTSLVDPLRSGKYDASIGIRGAFADKVFFRPVNGDRAYFKKDILPYLEKFKSKGYGLELSINYEYRNKRVKLVDFHKIHHLFQFKKKSFMGAIGQAGHQWKEIYLLILKHERPFHFFYYSYLWHFYIGKQ
jgi:glycosyltransferase involved in cell wall biosynthesis